MRITLTLSDSAYCKILALDRELVRTKDYIGLAYFWATDFKHYLRDCTISSRRKVHQKMLEAGLEVDGSSPEHEKIVLKYAKGYNQ